MAPSGPLVSWHAVNTPAVLARFALLVLIAVLVADRPGPAALVWVAALAAVAVPAALLPRQSRFGWVSRLVEVAMAGVAAAVTGAAENFLPYLAAPVFSAALFAGAAEAVPLVGVATAVVMGAGVAAGRWGQHDFVEPAAMWLVLAGLTGLVGWSLHGALRRREAQPQPPPYVEATRLLTQLRTVARQLPGGTLDPGGIAAHLLDEIRAMVPVDRAAVLSASGGGRLVVLAEWGPDRVDWETSLDSDSAVADAWASQQTQSTHRSMSRTLAPGEVSALVIPLVAGVRTVALVAVEADQPAAYPQLAVARVGDVAAPAALRLEAALLFDEVRTLATAEERQRLAREIHDGVAQELVMVGYGIDNAMAGLEPDAPAAHELRALRAEVTRLITELRLSLFELRSEVDRHDGLAAAIADYARTIGSQAGLRVHLSLDESTARLPAATEAELLRIAQEAITNARKHARAENLWVTCEVDPPYARIEVSDDGLGIAGQPPDGRYGLSIMAERAERIRGQLEIRPRQPRGTTVAVVLGTAPRQGSLSPRQGVTEDHVQPDADGPSHQSAAGRRP